MQILHKAEVSGGLRSDAQPIKTILEERSPLEMKLPSWDSSGFLEIAEVQKDLGQETRSRRIFPLWERSYINGHDWVSSNFNTIMSFSIYSNAFQNGECRTTSLRLKRRKRIRNCCNLDTSLILFRATFKRVKWKLWLVNLSFQPSMIWDGGHGRDPVLTSHPVCPHNSIFHPLWSYVGPHS